MYSLLMISPQLVLKTLKTNAADFDEYISDHTEISITLLWMKSEPGNSSKPKLRWNFNDKPRIEEWKHLISNYLTGIHLNNSSDFQTFCNDFHQISKRMKRISKKVFKKRNLQKNVKTPPFWYQLIRKTQKIIRGKCEYIRDVLFYRHIDSSYFTDFYRF